ncbi:MAG: ABC transporter ATP-binding protein [Acetobacteraceae bacterium]
MSGLDAVIERKDYHVAATGRGLTVLRDVRLQVAPGEFVCILGPSGCGKSTLLQILAGLDDAYQGRVSFPGGTRPKLGVMFQTPRLMPWLTVRANLDLVADAAAAASGRADALLRDMRLDAFTDSFPGRLSGGMQRRVSLARACLNRPELLLLDEPFVSLDAPTAAELRDWLIAEWQGAARQSVVCLTHDLREALALADRVLFLSPRPGSVVLEHRVDLPRPRGIEDAAVARLRDTLLLRWPNLLSGEAASPA